MLYAVFGGLFLLALGYLLLRTSSRNRTLGGLPDGEIVYSDTGQWEDVAEPLISRRYGLVGRPDYLVRTTHQGTEVVIPVEVKSRARPETPYASHILQLATYCLLVEEAYGVRPPHGLLQYADGTVQIPFDDDLRVQVLESAASIRSARRAVQVERQHCEPARCLGCGYRTACGSQALV